MPRIHVELDEETAARLQDLALDERRPTSWQAEVLIRRGVGLPASRWVSGAAAQQERPDERK
jgi:predicted transcriptional regulator